MQEGEVVIELGPQSAARRMRGGCIETITVDEAFAELRKMVQKDAEK